MTLKLLAGAEDHPLAALHAAARYAYAEALIAALAHREAREPASFAGLILWAMEVMQDDESLVDMFGISMATLKRWSKGETTPLSLARESVLVRLDHVVCKRFGIAAAAPVPVPYR